MIGELEGLIADQSIDRRSSPCIDAGLAYNVFPHLTLHWACVCPPSLHKVFPRFLVPTEPNRAQGVFVSGACPQSRVDLSNSAQFKILAKKKSLVDEDKGKPYVTEFWARYFLVDGLGASAADPLASLLTLSLLTML